MKYLNSCSNILKTNLVTFIPDNQPITLSPASPPGFYVLYPPSTTRTTPLLVYFNGVSSPELYGWTTFVPLNCDTGANYTTGLCSFLYQAVEESTSYWQRSIESIDRTDIIVTGRFTSPKVIKNNEHTKGEFYCLYSLNNVDPFQLLNTSTVDYGDLELGFISYRQPPAEVLVSQKIFGTAVIGNLRGIGRYQDILDSLNYVNITQQFELPEPAKQVEEFGSVVWNKLNQSLTFSEGVTSTVIYFDKGIDGFIIDSSGKQVKPINNSFYLLFRPGNLTINLNNLTIQPNTMVTILIGNQKTQFIIS
jgi:hypothetical protein